MLEDILKQSQPGVNPELEEMIGKMMLGSGSSGPQADGAVSRLSGRPQSAPALGIQQQGPQGAPQAPAQGAGAALPDEQANMTLQVLIRAGVPPEIAEQAIRNPEMLQALLMQIQQGANQGPQEMQTQAPSSMPNRPSAPPVPPQRY